MARQRLGEKKTRQLRERLGLPIVVVLVRGGTDHRQDLCLADGTIRYYWPQTGDLLLAENITHQFKETL